MPKVTVECDECPGKVWRWLCVDCAEDCITRHRNETGHNHITMTLVAEPTIKELRKQIASIRGFSESANRRRLHQRGNIFP